MDTEQHNPKFTVKDILEYEVRGSWWASLVPWGWAQDLAGKYFAWKVHRKFTRYKDSIEIQQYLKSIGKL